MSFSAEYDYPGLTSSGTLDVLCTVHLATIAALPACTAAGSGPGKTLTGDAPGALSMDGEAVVVDRLYLVKNEADPENHGIYVATDPGGVADPFILTRWEFADSIDELTAGGIVNITAGSQVGQTWYLATPLTEIDVTEQTWQRMPSSDDVAALQAAIDAVKVDTEALLVDTTTLKDAVDTEIPDIKTAVETDIPNTLAQILEDTGTTLPSTLATLATAANLAIVDGIVDEILLDTATLGVPAGVSHAADNAAIKADTAAILEDTGTTIPATLATLATAADLAIVDGVVDEILLDTATLGTPAGATHAADNAAIKADTAAILEDTGTTLPGLISVVDGVVDSILVLATLIQRPLVKEDQALASNGGVTQVFAASGGDVHLYASLTYAEGAPDAGLLSLQLTIGKLGTEVVVISHAQAPVGQLDAESRQASSTGCWLLKSGDVGKLTAIGSGGGSTNFTVSCTWAPATVGGVLS